ncbi:putative serine/threonine-protein kinase PBL3 [Sesamum alatum]|uniref:non-specific serine/threonine protein kinase n=1 Tax=Sesamum alatum TaxID=300844 RepID=A0AAE1YWK3_9LAMI|nr:putative serine/threonine-protein kinase PBL3 [Sesamum alatum]
MGNCIQKTNRVVLEFDHPSAGNIVAQKFIRGQKKDNNYEKGNFADWQKQKAFGNVKKTMNPPQMPPVSGCLENSNPKSHPLPTPNLTSNTSHHRHRKQPSFLPLPKPETPPKQEESGTSTGTSQPETYAASCILPMPMSESEILSSPYLRAFSLGELRKATANFCENSLLGEGGFGCVYKGWLDVETLTAARPGSGMPVAIKKLIHSGYQGHNEWLSEVNYLGRLRHQNLVKLVGYCLDGEDRILVYEFMPGGSLEKHLFKRNSPSLSWARRIKVAVGAARGLCFLHESKSPVIYRDFKTSNILLDTEFNAKLSDFGLAKAGPTTDAQTHVTTRVMGTEGYCDPRYLTTEISAPHDLHLGNSRKPSL